jgi:hypothetical protein
MTTEEAIDIIRNKLSYKFWIDRAVEMLRSVIYSNTCPNQNISRLRVSPDWPVVGTISFTREADGKKIVMRLNKNKFVAYES